MFYRLLSFVRPFFFSHHVKLHTIRIDQRNLYFPLILKHLSIRNKTIKILFTTIKRL